MNSDSLKLRLEPDNTFTLKDIADKCQIRKIRTAQHYLHDYLPPHHRQGTGKGCRYSEATLNCFQFLVKLKNETPLTLEQISSVMKLLDPKRIDQIVNAKEPLEIVLMVNEEMRRAGTPKTLTGPVPRDAILIRGNTARILSKALPGSGDNRQRRDEGNRHPQDDWNVVPSAGHDVEVRYKGDLSDYQLDELKIVTSLLTLIIEGQRP